MRGVLLASPMGDLDSMNSTFANISCLSSCLRPYYLIIISETRSLKGFDFLGVLSLVRFTISFLYRLSTMRSLLLFSLLSLDVFRDA